MVHTSAQRVVGDSLLGGISETMKTFLVKKKKEGRFNLYVTLCLFSSVFPFFPNSSCLEC